MSVGEDMCNFTNFRPATLTVTNFFKQVSFSVEYCHLALVCPRTGMGRAATPVQTCTYNWIVELLATCDVSFGIRVLAEHADGKTTKAGIIIIISYEFLKFDPLS